MAAEVPFLAAAYKSFPGIFARQNAQGAPSASLWLTNICVQICLVLIWLTGSDYNTLLTIASEMILVPYFLVGAFLLKIATRPSIGRSVSEPVFMAYGYYMRRAYACCCPSYCTRTDYWFSCMRVGRTSMTMY